MKKVFPLSLVLVLATLITSFIIYPSLPEVMATHWDLAGEPNGYMTRFWGAFLVPLMTAVMLGLFLLIPGLDPLKSNLKKFRAFFDGFVVLMVGFMAYVHGLVLAWNLGVRFNMGTAIIPAMGLLFFYIGILLEHSKRNWFVGIKTPWTMSSDRVWVRTHRLGGRVFKIYGVLTVLTGLFLPGWAMTGLLISLLVISLGLVVYSYVEFKKEKSR
ncbi:MAG TPA: SdpI family protein [archaeon]|nr:SdpI family protein [archaeon]